MADKWEKPLAAWRRIFEETPDYDCWPAPIRGWEVGVFVGRIADLERQLAEALAREQTLISGFVARVNARAEAEMQRTGVLEGAHHRAIEAELTALTATPTQEAFEVFCPSCGAGSWRYRVAEKKHCYACGAPWVLSEEATPTQAGELNA